KRTEDELKSDKSKNAESSEKKAEGSRKKSIIEEDTDEVEMKKHMDVVQDEEEIAIDDIPLATKPLLIVEYKIVKEGQKGFYHLIKADESSQRYSSMIRMLQGIDREDLETLWNDVWRNLQGYKVTVWKLLDNCGVHFVRFRNLHIFMLVEKRYPLTPITISNKLNKKLQADHWNEMCYQLLKLITKQEKGQ
ncbi:hypothetical protein Tco_1388399, partial [Tanacetum coccineum]